MVKKRKKKPQVIRNNYNTYVYGIDASLNDTGVCIYSLTTHEIVYTGHIDTTIIRNLRKYDGYDVNSLKLNLIHEYFTQLVEEYPPNIVILERGFAKFKPEVQALNQSLGIIKKVFWQYSQILYSPLEVKSAICSGKAEKLEVRDVLIANIPTLKEDELFFNNDNVSDAVAVLITYLLKSEIYDPRYWSKIDTEHIEHKNVIKKRKPSQRDKRLENLLKDLS